MFEKYNKNDIMLFDEISHLWRGKIMKYKFISDNHIHSSNSFDAKDSVIMLADRAFNLGLYSVTITDHCDCDVYYKNDLRSSIEGSIRDTLKARGLYSNRLKIYSGIELGQPTQDLDAAQEALSLGNYDFVLGSLHNLRNEQDFYYLNYTAENTGSLLERYFDEMMELIEYGKFDSLAHLTYPFRYLVSNPELKITPKDYSQQIDEVLEAIIKKDIALEVNTSGLRQPIGKTLPDEDVIRRYRELGGKYVTMGSDAHRWGDVGAGIEDGLNMLLKCGFTHFTVYRRREPVMLPIL